MTKSPPETSAKKRGGGATADGRWDAVSHLRPAADGTFVYAVTTTGVFCRPSCSSRMPLRKNVEFFDTCAEATRAGFRACKRCKPEETAPAEVLTARIVSACRMLEAQEPTRTEAVAQQVGLSPFYFCASSRVTSG